MRKTTGFWIMAFLLVAAWTANTAQAFTGKARLDSGSTEQKKKDGGDDPPRPRPTPGPPDWTLSTQNFAKSAISDQGTTDQKKPKPKDGGDDPPRPHPKPGPPDGGENE